MLNPPDSEFVPLKALLESRPKPRFAFDRQVQFGNILLGLIGDEFRLKPNFDRFSTVTFFDETGVPLSENCNIDVFQGACPIFMDTRRVLEHYEIRNGKIRRVL